MNLLLELQWFVEDNWWIFLLLSTIFLGIIAFKKVKK